MLQYYSLFLLIVLQAFILFLKDNTPKKRMLFCVITGIELACVIGLRSVNVGIDTFTYAEIFREVSYTKLFALFSSGSYLEYGFLLYSKILSFISSEPQIMFICSAAILMIGVMSFIYKNTKLVWMSALIYISAVGDFRWALTATRQTIAMAFILFAFEAVKKRRLFWFTALVLIGASFHRTALCFLPAYFLYNFRFDLKNVLFSLFCAAAVYINLQPILTFLSGVTGLYQGYLGGEGLSYLTDALIKASILGFAVVMLFLTRTKADKEMNLLLWFALLALIFAIFSFKFFMLMRFELYFAMFAIVLIPKVFELIKNRGLFVMLFIAFFTCAMLFTHTAVTQGARNLNFLPYEFFWQNPGGERRWNFTDSYMPW